MRFSVLGSGSKGNSIYVESGSSSILIDNGFSGKELDRRLKLIDRSIHELDGVCITHEHNDHIGGVGVVSRRCKIPVYANEGTYRGAKAKLGKLHKRYGYENGERFAIGDLEVQAFPISHDTLDPVGYVVNDGSSYLGICTDTGMVTKLMELRLARCQGLVLEFNHNLEMLKNGPYPLPLQQRVRSNKGHLSNEDGAKLLQALIHPGLKYGVLAHLSEINNNPELARVAAKRCDFSQNPETQLLLASQEKPSSLLSLS